MDILIKNMKLPKKMECLEILLFNDGYTTYRVHERDEWTSTKAIEIPPHGRCIDANKILEQSVIDTPIGKVVYPFSIDSAPTVLEANDG